MITISIILIRINIVITINIAIMIYHDSDCHPYHPRAPSQDIPSVPVDHDGLWWTMDQVGTCCCFRDSKSRSTTTRATSQAALFLRRPAVSAMCFVQNLGFTLW